MGDWIDDFMDLTDGLPSPRIFRLWSGITCIAGALERRAWIETAQSNVYPNLFVVLVAPPGVGKTQAVNPVEDFWKDCKKFKVMPNNVTKAALIDALVSAGQTRIFNDGANILEYHSICVPASELGVLLPAHELEYLSVLNYIYDNPASYREERRSIENPIEVIHPQLTILAGTQPGFLSATLPEEAWSMGFLSRVIMVYSATSPRVRLFGTKRSDKDALRSSLTSRLEALWDLHGAFAITQETIEALEAWAEDGFDPIPPHSKLVHYNARRVLHVLKLTMISAIARTGRLTIGVEDLLRAKEWLLEVEVLMPDVFKDMMAKSDGAIIQELHSFMWGEYLRTKNKPLHESLLYAYLQTKVPVEKISRILETAERARFIARAGDKLYTPMVKNLTGISETKMTIDCEYDQETSQCPVCSKPVTWKWARGLYHGFITEKHNVLMADCVYHSECWDKMERGAEFTALAADRDRLAEQLAAAKARIAELEIGLKAFLHLIKPDADDIESGRTDALSGLPDSHCFELTWAPEEPGSYITAGQIRRAARLLKRNPG